MILLKRNRFVRGLCFAAVFVWWAAGAGAADIILLSDNYDANGYAYPTSLRNHYVQSGTLAATTLYGGQNGMYYGTDFITTAGTSGNRAYVNINSGSLPAGCTILSSSIRMDSTLSSVLYFGYTGHAGTGAFDIGDSLSTDGVLYIKSTYSSSLNQTVNTLYYNKTIALASVTNSGGGLVEYNITYDFAANTVSARAGGTPMVSNYDLGNVGFTPDLQALQLQTASFGGSTGMAVADDLLVTARPRTTLSLVVLSSP